MNDRQEGDEDGAPIGAREFAFFCDLIQREAGIHISDKKQMLIASRLQRRLRQLSLTSFREYADRLKAGTDKDELREFINAITTNKTEFFREEHHFQILQHSVFPAVRARAAGGGPHRLRIWSAGCSTGEEPYSLAMTVRNHFGPATGWEIAIVASDIDTNVLKEAAAGIYREERLRGVSAEQLRRHFLRGRGAYEGLWRATPALRSSIEFRRVNLNEDPVRPEGPFDVIFCRNVIIYFDRPTQRRLFDRFARALVPDGWLFLGHSESLIGVSERFSLFQKTVHRLLPAGPRRTGLAAPSEPAPETRLHRRLVAGDVVVSESAMTLTTVLGSCVSACVYDPTAGVGGMNHFLLPHDQHQRGAGYGGPGAMESLVAELVSRGASRSRLHAKLFGGGHVIAQTRTDLPEQNAACARSFLARAGIPIAAERLGGAKTLEVHFDTETGHARVRSIARETPEVVAETQLVLQALGAGAAPSPQRR